MARRATTSNLAAIKDNIKPPERKSFTDDNMFKMNPKKKGEGEVTLRFLPSPDSDIPYVKYFNHGWKNSAGKWFIQPCPTTFGLECPVCKQNNIYWDDDQEDLARSRKRSLNFVSNILVINDQDNPDRNGKVFTFRYGKKIHDKIQEAVEGKIAYIEGDFNPFDYYDGADFKLVLKQVSGYNNYDSSAFTLPKPIATTEDEIDAIDAQLHNISHYDGKAELKSYEELSALYLVNTGVVPPLSKEAEALATAAQLVAATQPAPVSATQPAPVAEVKAVKKEAKVETKVETSAKSKIFEELKKK